MDRTTASPVNVSHLCTVLLNEPDIANFPFAHLLRDEIPFRARSERNLSGDVNKKCCFKTFLSPETTYCRTEPSSETDRTSLESLLIATQLAKPSCPRKGIQVASPLKALHKHTSLTSEHGTIRFSPSLSTTSLIQ